MTAAVREHHCGAWTYQLAGPSGPLILDTAATPGGGWQPQPDGRTAAPADPGEHGGWGHAVHSCIPEGQGELL